MALFTAQSRMFAGKWEAGLAMVHRLSIGFPMYQRKVHSVVVGVAPGTIIAGYNPSHPDRVHAAILNQTIADFGMAVQTFQLHSSRAQVVTFRAAQDSGK
jgi:hypothetical protein